jgi:hypothetical protein
MSQPGKKDAMEAKHMLYMQLKVWNEFGCLAKLLEDANLDRCDDSVDGFVVMGHKRIPQTKQTLQSEESVPDC